MRVVKECIVTATTSADSAFVRIANDTMTRRLMRSLWDSSDHANPDSSARRERMGYWGFDTTHAQVMSVQPNSTGSTPCSVIGYSPSMSIRSDTQLVTGHVHPFSNRAWLPWVQCQLSHPGRYDGNLRLGVSLPDIETVLSPITNQWGVIVDEEHMIVYRAPYSSLSINHNVSPARLVGDWTPHVRRYDRTQHFSVYTCDIY